MSNEKSPFKGFTIKEVFAAESTTYIIQVGSDFFSYKGNFAFSKRGAAIFYGKILKHLQYIIRNGNKQESIEAKECLKTLRIIPLRIN